MNNENNNMNNNLNNNDKFMPVSNPEQINQSVPTMNTQPEILQPVENTQPEILTQTAEIPVPQPVSQPVVVPQEAPAQVVQEAVPSVNPQPQVDNNAMVNENLRKVEIKDNKSPGKFKIFLLFVFFALLIAFIIFLPEISSFIKNYNKPKENPVVKEDVITSGKLVCNLKANTSDLDKEYEFVFSFNENKLMKTKYTVNTKGDSTTEASLDELAGKCNTLKEYTASLEGVSIKCDYTVGNLIESQSFDLGIIDKEKLSAAYTEAGGMLTTYNLDEDINEVEKNMKASGYTCERQK